MSTVAPFKRSSASCVKAYRIGRGENLTDDEASIRLLWGDDAAICQIPEARRSFVRGCRDRQFLLVKHAGEAVAVGEL